MLTASLIPSGEWKQGYLRQQRLCPLLRFLASQARRPGPFLIHARGGPEWASRAANCPGIPDRIPGDPGRGAEFGPGRRLSWCSGPLWAGHGFRVIWPGTGPVCGPEHGWPGRKTLFRAGHKLYAFTHQQKAPSGALVSR